MGYPNKAIKYIENLLQRTAIRTNDIEMYLLFDYLSNAYAANRHHDMALEVSLAVYQLRQYIDPKSITLNPISVDLTNIGRNYTNNKQYDLALEYYGKALKTIHIDDYQLIAQLHHSIGHICGKQQNYIVAMRHFQHALDMLDKGNAYDVLTISEIHKDIGYIYSFIKTYHLAVKHLEYSIALRKLMCSINDPENGRILFDIGTMYREMKQYNKTIDIYYQALNILEKCPFHDIFEVFCIVFTNIAHTYNRMKKSKMAVEYYRKAVEIQLSLIPMDKWRLV
ncbi:unnamed protein product [Didymodactylos carnosus]|uniref:Uncharacterized protein n=1 Tax=Didymodactylos carnosus TaxID=1234261 RepID=A0A814AM61_9BILA|nr:unnamed protein product [Didymodactylos carnosus]CAF3696947.1 unnamed protein product [Didymodactylos carnosus]